MPHQEVRRWVAVGLVVGTLAWPAMVHGQNNSWTNSAGGFWQDAFNWSLGVPSSGTHLTEVVTNASSKTVTIDDNTVSAAPASLLINNLTLSAPAGSTNTLSVHTESTLVAFRIRSGLTITSGGVLAVTNSGVFVDGNSGGAFVDDGSVVLSNNSFYGLVITGVVTRIGNAGPGSLKQYDGTILAGTIELGNSGAGQLQINAGTLQASSISMARASGGSATLSVGGGTATLGALDVGANLAATGTVWVTGGRLSVPSTTLRIGGDASNAGRGQLTLSNGTVDADSMGIGVNAGSQGTLTVAGGSLTVANAFVAGYSAASAGTIWVKGGSLTVTTGPAYLGFVGASSLTLSNGTAQFPQLIVGNAGSAGSTLTLQGGTGTVSRLDVVNATGRVVFESGRLTVSTAASVTNGLPFVVGSNSTGTAVLNLPSGSHNFVDGLVARATAGSTGQIWLAGAELTVPSNVTTIAKAGVGQLTLSNSVARFREIYVGHLAGSRGTWTQVGGTNTLALWMLVGVDANATGSVWVSNGRLLPSPSYEIGRAGSGQVTLSNSFVQAGDVYLGRFPGSQGTLTIVGGTNEIANFFTIGNSADATGALWLTSGRLIVTNNYTAIGPTGAGRATISNGLWIAGTMFVGTGGTGTLSIVGGEQRVHSLLLLGDSPCIGSGIVNLSGGALYVTNAVANAVLEVRSGTLTVSGGQLTANQLLITDSCARFIHTGGTLSIGFISIAPGDDADGDGMPNWFEQANGLDPFNPADANLDSDGDGLSNLQEYLAGTSPTNSADVFRITSTAPETNGFRVTWATVAGKTNDLQRSLAMMNNFITIFSATNTAAGTTNYLDLGAITNTSRFYRVRLAP